MNSVHSHRAATLPPELLASAPREVALKAGGWTLLVLAVMMMIGGIAGAAALFSAHRLAAERQREVDADGATTLARVLRIELTRRENRRRIVSYSYLAEGGSYVGRVRLRQRDRRPLQEGQRIEIAYLRSRPQESWLPGYEVQPGLPPLGLLPVILLASSAGAVAIIWAVRRERRLLAEGRPAMARVLGSKSVLGKSKTIRVRYQYRTLSGALREGYFDVAKDPPAEGAEIPIVYHSEQTGRSARYPFPLVKVKHD